MRQGVAMLCWCGVIMVRTEMTHMSAAGRVACGVCAAWGVCSSGSEAGCAEGIHVRNACEECM